MTTALTDVVPTRGPAYDFTRPETRQPWLDFRQGGITATQMRDWRKGGAERRKILVEKTTGETDDLSRVQAIRHGQLREPEIAAWIEANFGISPSDHVYAHGENPRWIGTPDGVSLDPFTGALEVGPFAALSEIKTSKHDLSPGPLNDSQELLEIDPESYFHRTGYYTQMQGQMLVMNAARTLFVWERHDGVIDPETGTYSPVGPPQWCWVLRDQEFIDSLVEDTIEPALREIDAARLTHSLGELPPASELPAEHAAWVADLLDARDAEAVAKAKREAAWKKLQEHYLGEGKKDISIDAGFARVTVSTSEKSKSEVDEAGMRRRAPSLVERYEALRKRYTRSVSHSTQTLTVTRIKP